MVLTLSSYQASLERDAAAFIDIVREGDLNREVPGCPGWSAGDLARHLGGVHRWARDIIINGEPGDRPEGPIERDPLVAWLDQGAADLIGILRTVDPVTETWTFGPPPRQVAFWSRRQAHETAVHLLDAQRSQGIAGVMDPVLAADGVDEVVRVFVPRQVRAGRLPVLERGVRIVLADVDVPDLVLGGEGTDPAAPTEATVTGTAVDMLLALWRREGIDRLEVDGDVELVTSTFAAALTS